MRGHEAVIELKDCFEIRDDRALFVTEPSWRIEGFRFDAPQEVLVVDPVARGEDPMGRNRKIDRGGHRGDAAKATVFGGVFEKHIPAERVANGSDSISRDVPSGPRVSTQLRNGVPKILAPARVILLATKGATRSGAAKAELHDGVAK